MGLVDKGRLPKPLTSLFNMGRSYSLWVYQWGLACCAIEMGAAFGSPRYDVMRLGVIPLPASPRQADLVVISGTVTDKMAPGIKLLDEPLNDEYPMPMIANGRDEVFVGRLRRDESQPRTLNMWIVADNLRKGAATKAGRPIR